MSKNNTCPAFKRNGNTALVLQNQITTYTLIHYSFLLIGLRIEPANLSTLHTCINIPQQEDNRDNQTDLIRSGMLHIGTMTIVNCSLHFSLVILRELSFATKMHIFG